MKVSAWKSKIRYRKGTSRKKCYHCRLCSYVPKGTLISASVGNGCGVNEFQTKTVFHCNDHWPVPYVVGKNMVCDKFERED